MLLSHLQAVEDHLGPRARALASNEERRAAFVQTFAEPMFGGELRLRRGAVVGLAAAPDAIHPVFDLLLCQWDGPAMVLADGQPAWLAETVVATVSLCASLDEAAMAEAVRAAAAAKRLARRALTGGQGPVPPLRSYLVAFDGPASMQQAHVWMKLAYRRQGVDEADLPLTGAERAGVASPGLDGVFVLGRGFLNFDNVEVGLITDEARADTFGMCWAVASHERGALVSLWLQLQQAVTAMAGRRLDPRACAEGFSVPALRYAN